MTCLLIFHLVTLDFIVGSISVSPGGGGVVSNTRNLVVYKTAPQET